MALDNQNRTRTETGFVFFIKPTAPPSFFSIPSYHQHAHATTIKLPPLFPFFQEFTIPVNSKELAEKFIRIKNKASKSKMKLSCNGCRVLRKGCSKSCSIRSCLQWIESPESQAHATVFLAKFYGRTGLINLINSGPDDLRPAIFKSLLYEACGRIVNPTYGSVGLLWSGSWAIVEAAVEAVLKGEPIVPIASDAAAAAAPLPNPTYNVRHVSKTGLDSELHKVSKTTSTKFKRAAKASKHVPHTKAEPANEPELSHSSSNEGPIELFCCRAQQEVSADTVDAASHVSQGEPEDVGLNLSLGFGLEPSNQDCRHVDSKQPKRCESSSVGSTDACSLSLELHLRV